MRTRKHCVGGRYEARGGGRYEARGGGNFESKDQKSTAVPIHRGFHRAHRRSRGTRAEVRTRGCKNSTQKPQDAFSQLLRSSASSEEMRWGRQKSESVRTAQCTCVRLETRMVHVAKALNLATHTLHAITEHRKSFNQRIGPKLEQKQIDDLWL